MTSEAHTLQQGAALEGRSGAHRYVSGALYSIMAFKVASILLSLAVHVSCKITPRSQWAQPAC